MVSNQASGLVEGPLHYASLTDVTKLIETVKLSPSALTCQLLDRIEVVDGTLHGVPVSVKDLCCSRVVRTTAGTKIHSNFIPDFDAAVVARLESAGAFILG